MLFLISFAGKESVAQKESWNWYFGAEAGINFSSGTAQPVYDGATDATEGVASISDKDGNLLFYTDGIQVWNRNHQIMQRGGHLYGHRSSTQSGIIVPQPGNDSLYYIFTVDAFEGIKGLNYNIVNMKMDNGLGDVVTFPQQLLTPTFEKITAVRHCNNRDIWIITRSSVLQSYYAWLLTPAGLSSTPVISPANGFAGHYIGYLKASPDAKKLVSVNYDTATELSRFDNATGIVSNTLLIAKRKPIPNTDYIYAYGAEFSPDNKQLYITTSYALGITRPVAATIDQFDISIHDSAAIENSHQTIVTDNNIHNALQLGPDKKIYAADNVSHYLSRINNPNGRGANAGYEAKAVFLGDRAICYSGLPTFIQSLFDPLYNGYAFTTTPACDPLIVNFALNDQTYLDSVRWDFGDPASGTANVSNSFNPSHLYSRMGTYTVQAIVYIHSPCLQKPDTIRNSITVAYPFSLGADQSFCKDAGNLTLNAACNGATAWLWSTGETTAQVTVSNTGTYWCQASINGCPYRDTIVVTKDSTPALTLPPYSICNNQPVRIQVETVASWILTWPDGSHQNSYTVYSPGQYALTVANGCGTVQKEISVKQGVCSIYIPAAFTPGNDALNNSFKVLGTEKITVFYLQIFNRYGQRLYASSDKNAGWDGRLGNKPADAGTYTYLLRYQEYGNPVMENITGTFILIR
ncbi:MAG: gliding motility-associated C-terminal domain-containing protein [Ferruginibacter sp.]